MSATSFALLLWSLPLGLSDGPEYRADTGKTEKSLERQAITPDDARIALNRLVESPSFLADSPGLDFQRHGDLAQV